MVAYSVPPFDPDDGVGQNVPRAGRGSPSPKKAENHAHIMAIYFMHYNFVHIYQTLKITSAMAANVTSKLWEMSDMVQVLEAWEAQ